MRLTLPLLSCLLIKVLRWLAVLAYIAWLRSSNQLIIQQIGLFFYIPSKKYCQELGITKNSSTCDGHVDNQCENDGVVWDCRRRHCRTVMAVFMLLFCMLTELKTVAIPFSLI